MRRKLAKNEGLRTRFQGTFERYGKKSAFRGPPQTTILLKDVFDVETKKIRTDHLWFNLTKGFQVLGLLKPGDIVLFDARVVPYEAGYRGYREDAWLDNPLRTDYKLSHPTKIARENH